MNRRAGPALLQRVLLVIILHLGDILCASDVVRFSVPEEGEAGVRVGTLGEHFPSPPYRLLTQDYLWVSETTGDLYTTERRLDREALCRPPEEEEETAARGAKYEECVLPHNAIVGPSGDLVRFLVVLEDVNDHAPRFQNDGGAVIRLSVPEDVAVGTRFLLDARARDGDGPGTGPNGEVRYRLEGPDDYDDDGGLFGLTVEDESGHRVLMLVVERPLDRENRAEHHMTLVASDGGSPPLSAAASLTVSVTDVNDNCPSFASSYSSYDDYDDRPRGDVHVTVPGDARRGTPVTRVVATDRDAGPNAAVAYSFSPQVSARARELFSLDGRTGRIALARDLSDSDGPTEELWVLKVLASGPHCPPAHTRVTVSVLPAAGQVPAIKIGFIAEHRSDGTIVLPENQPPTVLALLELGGGDGRTNTGTSLSIEGGEEEEVPFTLSLQKNGKYLLSTARPLDYEAKREYDIAVVAVGVGEGAVMTPQRSPRRAIRVVVVDVNDNAPRFSRSHYQLEVEENNEPGAWLLTVAASDADGGPHNGRVTYRLGGKHAAAAGATFRLDRTTGRLSAAVPLDRERQAVHTLTVLARDGGSPPLESAATVRVRVTDQNDNAPAFLSPHFVFFVRENAPCGGPGRLADPPVGRGVAATDPDEGENGRVEVRLMVNGSGGGGGGGGAAFMVDNASGTLRCAAGGALLDREARDRYELYLVASDHGRSPAPRTSVARVTVFVEDVNDNRPRVVLPGSNLSCLTVPLPATRAGATVAKVYAVDDDSGLNADITYTVAARQSRHHGGGSPLLFRLDPRSGNVTLARGLTDRDLGMHHLLAVVSDRGEPSPLHTAVWVNLLVVNESTAAVAGPCPRLDSVPRSLPYRLAAQPHPQPQTPPTTTTKAPPGVVCELPEEEGEEEGGTAKQAQLTLLVGSAMMLASICLCAATAVFYLKQRRRRAQWSRRRHNDIPLRMGEKQRSDE